MPDSHDTRLWRNGCASVASGQLDRRVGWDRLGGRSASASSIGSGTRCGRDNLSTPSTGSALNPQPLPPAPPRALVARTTDGSYNDLDAPDDGDGRNPVRPQRAARRHAGPSRRRGCSTPNPREISRALLTRGTAG